MFSPQTDQEIFVLRGSRRRTIEVFLHINWYVSFNWYSQDESVAGESVYLSKVLFSGVVF